MTFHSNMCSFTQWKLTGRLPNIADSNRFNQRIPACSIWKTNLSQVSYHLFMLDMYYQFVSRVLIANIRLLTHENDSILWKEHSLAICCIHLAPFYVLLHHHETKWRSNETKAVHNYINKGLLRWCRSWEYNTGNYTALEHFKSKSFLLIFAKKLITFSLSILVALQFPVKHLLPNWIAT